MKLISMHVDDFGKLHNYDYRFNDRLNIILEDNGWGKTTMASFLKAMLYGFGSSYGHDENRAQREHYKPWQGGNYGGMLEYEAEGKKYRITRHFGDTADNDSVSVINLETGTMAGIDTARIGETLFGLDANAFQRSVFIDQNGLHIDGAAESIHNRLNTLVQQANDVEAYDGAISRLSAKAKVYEKTGDRGELGEINRRIEDSERMRERIEGQLKEQDASRRRTAEISVMIETMNAELDKKKADLEQASMENKNIESTKKQLEEIGRQIAEKQILSNGLKMDLGGSIPSKAEMKELERQRQSIIDRSDDIASAKKDLRNIEESQELLSGRYHEALPSDEEIDALAEIYGEIQGLNKAIDEENLQEAPENYEIVKLAADSGLAYIASLKDALAREEEINDLTQKISTAESDIRHENESWSKTRTQFAALEGEVSRLQNELSQLEMYRPEQIEPVVNELMRLKDRYGELAKEHKALQTEIAEDALKKEEEKKQYDALKEKEKKLSAEMQGSAAYAGNVVSSAIAKLDDLRKREQALTERKNALHASSLSTGERTLLQNVKKDIPTREEAKDILEKYRTAMHDHSEIKNQTALLEQEKADAETLKTSIAKQDESLAALPEAVANPGRGNGTLLIILGVIAIAAGIYFGMNRNTVLFTAAAVGLVVLITGFMANSSHKKKQEAYRVYTESLDQKKEAETQKEETQKRLLAKVASIQTLEESVESLTKEMNTFGQEVVAWVSKYTPVGTPVNEKVILKVTEDAEEVRRVQEKAEQSDSAQNEIKHEQESLFSQRDAICSSYPILEGLSITEALGILRSKADEYLSLSKQYEEVEASLSRFENGQGVSQQTSSADAQNFDTRQSEMDKTMAALNEERKRLNERYPEMEGLSYDGAASLLRSRMSSYSVTKAQLATATQNQNQFLEAAGITRKQIEEESSPRYTTMLNNLDAMQYKLNEAIHQVNVVLGAIQLTMRPDNCREVFAAANQRLSDYQQYNEKLKEKSERQEKRRIAIGEKEELLKGKTAVLQDNYSDEENFTKRLTMVRADISESRRLSEKKEEAEAEIAEDEAAINAANEYLQEFRNQHAFFETMSEDPLEEICEKVEEHEEIMSMVHQLYQQRTEVLNLLRSFPSDSAEKEIILRQQIANMESQRDKLLIEYTQKTDMIHQTDASMEEYLDVVQETRQLYQRKEAIQNELMILRKTISLIQQAKENLADRYLNRVEQLFNDYMHVWLNSDAVRGILDVDFNIAIEDNDGTHGAEGFSSGYSDLIDFCMRLALVDTLFKDEKPFLIMDDPFVNLDQDRLEKALVLLNALSASKQIIYFCCHPVRAEEVHANSDVRDQFMKLSQTAGNALEKHSADYGTDGSFMEQPQRYTVSTYSEIPFVIDSENCVVSVPQTIIPIASNPSSTVQNQWYELFFIDENETVQSDRVLLEIRNGRLSKQQLRFTILERSTHGHSYELLVRETRSPEFELAGRIPFSAD